MTINRWCHHMSTSRPRTWRAIKWPVVLGAYVLYVLAYTMSRIGDEGDRLYRFIGVWRV